MRRDAVREPAQPLEWSQTTRSRVFAAYRRVALVPYSLLVAWLFWLFSQYRVSDFTDAQAYFRAASDPAAMYSQHTVDTARSYLYSPAFAQVLAPATLGGWTLFSAAWFALGAAALWWLAREWSPVVLFVPVVYSLSPAGIYLPVLMELMFGNIQLLLAAAFVLSLRWPALWTLPLLTKPTFGVGLLWYAARQEWHNLFVALATTSMIVLASAVLAPPLWGAWIEVLRENATSSSPSAYDAPFQFLPLPARLICAGVLVIWGARSNRRWTVIVAAMIAMPVVWRTAPAILVGLLGLWRREPKQNLAKRRSPATA